MNARKLLNLNCIGLATYLRGRRHNFQVDVYSNRITVVKISKFGTPWQCREAI
jgi:hypothetical protein